MGRFSERDTRDIGAIEHALATIDDRAPHILRAIVTPLRELLRTDVGCCYMLMPRGDGLELEHFHTERWPNAQRAKSIFNDFLRDKLVGWGWYNPIRPEREQRNRVQRMVDLGKRPSELPEFLPKMGVGGMDQMRVLVCEGPSLLGWVGAFQHGAFDTRQARILQRLVAPLKKRLTLDRRLRSAPILEAALASTLDAMGRAVFLIDGRGRIAETNALGRQMQARDRAGLAAALADCARRPFAPSRFAVTRVAAEGCADHFLVMAPSSEIAEVDHRCALAASRWKLTARQRQVLRELASGATNRVIAATLGTSERTIEVHVGAIFDKAAVSSRAELIAALWSRSP